jgi:adenylate kinase family enzyme
MKRVMMIGARQVDARENAWRRLRAFPLSLDQIHFLPGREPQDGFQLIADIAARDEWIIEGGYTATFPIRMPRSDTIIWLDFSRRVCIPRILKRIIVHDERVRGGAAPGRPERLNLMKWAWTSIKSMRRNTVSRSPCLHPMLKW